MIDNVLLHSKVQPSPDVFEKDCFAPFKTGYNLHLFGHCPPLFVKCTANGVTLANSLHKAFAGNNFTTFTRTDIETACLALTDIFELEPSNFKVLRLEVKANVTTPESAQSYLHAYKTYKTKPFYFAPPPIGFTRPLLIAAHTTDKTLKLYDTGNYNRLKQSNLLSYEVVYKNARTITAAAKQSVTLANLPTFEVLNNLQNNALTMLKECTYLPDSLPPDAIGCLGKHWVNKLNLLTAPPVFWATLKNVNYNTYKEKRKELNELKRTIAPYLPPDVSGLVSDKFNEALSA